MGSCDPLPQDLVVLTMIRGRASQAEGTAQEKETGTGVSGEGMVSCPTVQKDRDLWKVKA